VIVVDSSVWIDFFNGRLTKQTDLLDDLLGERPVVVGDLILAEVLCGFRHDADFRQAKTMLEGCEFRPMAGKTVALAAAGNYRQLRKSGITVRKTIDMLIGSYCLLHHLPLLHADRDYDALEDHLGLIVWRGELG
jgi:predicted nucleic acid-binding protein